tara:strand:- start:23 stop:157 length:135 start_codon:yes stop_codon:yes gene_type:complete
MTQMLEQQKENNRILEKMTDKMSLNDNNNTNDDKMEKDKESENN